MEKNPQQTMIVGYYGRSQGKQKSWFSPILSLDRQGKYLPKRLFLIVIFQYEN